jgi:hypothetical protein
VFGVRTKAAITATKARDTKLSGKVHPRRHPHRCAGHRVSICTCVVRCERPTSERTSGLRIGELGGIELATGERDRLGAGRDRAVRSEATIRPGD